MGGKPLRQLCFGMRSSIFKEQEGKLLSQLSVNELTCHYLEILETLRSSINCQSLIVLEILPKTEMENTIFGLPIAQLTVGEGQPRHLEKHHRLLPPQIRKTLIWYLSTALIYSVTAIDKTNLVLPCPERLGYCLEY